MKFLYKWVGRQIKLFGGLGFMGGYKNYGLEQKNFVDFSNLVESEMRD